MFEHDSIGLTSPCDSHASHSPAKAKGVSDDVLMRNSVLVRSSGSLRHL